MSEREKVLERALRAFVELSFEVDAAPGPSFYIVTPVQDAREALENARKVLAGENPYPADDPKPGRRWFRS